MSEAASLALPICNNVRNDVDVPGVVGAGTGNGFPVGDSVDAWGCRLHGRWSE